MSTLLILLIVAAVIYFIVKQFKRREKKVDDNSFEQHGVKVTFAEGKITINGHTYDVNQVTGIRTITDGGLGTVKGVEISVDDFKKPIHKVVIGGFGQSQRNFAQSLSIALRKAGGPSFS